MAERARSGAGACCAVAAGCAPTSACATTASCATPPASSAASPADPDYLSPGAWDALDAPEGTFTLAAGDILVYGAVEDEITEDFSAAALLKKYERGGAMVVQSAKENTALCGLAHYVARSSWGSAVQRGHRP